MNSLIINNRYYWPNSQSLRKLITITTKIRTIIIMIIIVQNLYKGRISNPILLQISILIIITIYSLSRLMTKYRTIIITQFKITNTRGQAYRTKIIGHFLLSPNPIILISIIPQCHHINNYKSIITWHHSHTHNHEILSLHASCHHHNTDLNRLGMNLNRHKRMKCFRKLLSPNSWMESIITKKTIIKKIIIIIIQPIN